MRNQYFPRENKLNRRDFPFFFSFFYQGKHETLSCDYIEDNDDDGVLDKMTLVSARRLFISS